MRTQPTVWAAGTALVVPAVLALGVLVARPAAADALLCEPYATADVGRYVVQNNRWGAASTQCLAIPATGSRDGSGDGSGDGGSGEGGSGFTVVASAAEVPTDGAPAGYPSVVWGCHYGRCSDDFSPLPVAGTAFARVSTSVTVSRIPGGDWDAAYDLWLDPAPRRTGHDGGAELMVWLDHAGRPQPSGHRVGNAVVEGRAYDVYVCAGGSRTITYVSRVPSVHAGFAVRSFVDDAVARGIVDRSWYLTSIQAGVELWRGGAGLALSGFRVDT
jgi:Glycosyl hydrolase family 12